MRTGPALPGSFIFRPLSVSMRFAIKPFRLLFKRPFGTTHGMRDGTDSLFVRLEEGGVFGYGEVTLPPYLEENVTAARASLEAVARANTLSAGQLYERLEELTSTYQLAPGCRAGLELALIDLIGKQLQLSAVDLLGIKDHQNPLCMVTLGMMPVEEVAAALADLPHSDVLKVKVGDEAAAGRLQAVQALDARRLFLDGNQGMRSVQEVRTLVDHVRYGRLVGIEQPFDVLNDELNHDVIRTCSTDVYGDESIRNIADVSQRGSNFSELNLKLMKCGGLGLAKQMATEARRLGKKVMLGSMSESSLGCTAMAQLAPMADLLDLDGPWLLKNDPFSGVGMNNGKMVMPSGPGLGVVPALHLDYEACA